MTRLVYSKSVEAKKSKLIRKGFNCTLFKDEIFT